MIKGARLDYLWQDADMPRRTRVHLDGVPLHIVQRGYNREPCFFCEDDYASYLYWLGKALDETGCALHAYVLMTNHVHLLLTPRKAAAVPRLIISLGRRYVQYINRTYRRTGTLWDSRYKSSCVQAEPYLLQCQRYIELNPVRAAMVDDPGHYRWSSYRSHALGQTDPGSRRTSCTRGLDATTRNGSRRIGRCSGRNWTAKPSTTYGWPSIRISRLAMSASWPGSKRPPASGGKPGHAAGRG